MAPPKQLIATEKGGHQSAPGADATPSREPLWHSVSCPSRTHHTYVQPTTHLLKQEEITGEPNSPAIDQCIIMRDERRPGRLNPATIYPSSDRLQLSDLRKEKPRQSDLPRRIVLVLMDVTDIGNTTLQGMATLIAH